MNSETYGDLVRLVRKDTVDEAVAAVRALGEAAVALLAEGDLSDLEAASFRDLLIGCSETLLRVLTTTDRRQDAAAETLCVLAGNCPAVLLDISSTVGEALAGHLTHPERRLPAVCTVGALSEEDPPVAAPVVDEVTRLTRADDETVRHLATGALVRLPREDPTAVTSYVDILADRLQDQSDEISFLAAVGLTRVVDEHPGCVVAAVDEVSSAHVEADDVGVLMHGLLDAAGMVDIDPQEVEPTYVPGETFGSLSPDDG